MSWDSYIDNLKAHSMDNSSILHCDKACIIGLDGGASWTSSSHPSAFKLTAAEGAAIAKCFKLGDFTEMQASGIYAEGKKYQFLRIQDKLVLGKMKGEGAISLQASKTAIVIAHCPEGQQQGNANKSVGYIAEYLESQEL